MQRQLSQLLTVSIIFFLFLTFNFPHSMFHPNRICQAPPPPPSILETESNDLGYSLVEFKEDRFLLVGQTEGPEENQTDLLLVFISGYEYPSRTRTYGGVGNETGRAIVRCSEGGFAIIGSTTSYGAGGSDVWLVRLNSTGEPLWNRTYGSTTSDYGTSLVSLSEGGFAIAGYTDDGGETDVWLIRTDKDGNTLWNRTYGGPADDVGWSIVQSSDAGFAIAGYTTSYGSGGKDFWIIRTDSQGMLVWNQTYGGKKSDVAWQITPVWDGGFAVIGSTCAPKTDNTNAWLILTNVNGELQSDQTFGRENDDVGYDVIVCREGDFALTGFQDQGIWFTRTGGYGATSTMGPYYTYGMAIIQSSEGDFAIVGSTNRTSTESSHLVFWRLPSHYGPPTFGNQIILYLILFGSIFSIIIISLKCRRQKNKVSS
jgi:predicted secreted protein